MRGVTTAEATYINPSKQISTRTPHAGSDISIPS